MFMFSCCFVVVVVAVVFAFASFFLHFASPVAGRPGGLVVALE